ncbi:UNVERIFIED_CONTAM: hypothetical protein FKN15_062577 [Acipenser sinensis]
MQSSQLALEITSTPYLPANGGQVSEFMQLHASNTEQAGAMQENLKTLAPSPVFQKHPQSFQLSAGRSLSLPV